MASPDGRAEWEEALRRFEDDLQDALAQIDPVPWRPPIALGPIPPELVERAARIIEAQAHTIRYLEDVRQTTAKHLAAVRAVPAAEVGAHPVYFDLIG
ncbi:hypothetical protein [Leifsonia poae]|uniref:hypothetical protein n=1 Tax=Leifsonia poae TaxID=110933 RepID=UPI001CBDB3D6|nr:hypothetical protein [Leifsonia poae]